MIKFFVPGTPISKKSPKFRRRGKAFPVAITPEETVNYETLVAYAAKNAMGPRAPLEGPIRIDYDVTLPIPTSWSKIRKERARQGVIKPTVKPDFGRIMLSIEDGCNQVAFVDDKQVTSGQFCKRYGDKPGVWVYIYEDEGRFWNADIREPANMGNKGRQGVPNRGRRSRSRSEDGRAITG